MRRSRAPPTQQQYIRRYVNLPAVSKSGDSIHSIVVRPERSLARTDNHKLPLTGSRLEFLERTSGRDSRMICMLEIKNHVRGSLVRQAPRQGRVQAIEQSIRLLNQKLQSTFLLYERCVVEVVMTAQPAHSSSFRRWWLLRSCALRKLVFASPFFPHSTAYVRAYRTHPLRMQ